MTDTFTTGDIYNRARDDAAIAISGEARCLVNRIENNVRCRRQHPTYGYTKAMAREALAQLEGLCYALAQVKLNERSANFAAQATEAAATFLSVDLADLRQQIKES